MNPVGRPFSRRNIRFDVGFCRMACGYCQSPWQSIRVLKSAVQQLRNVVHMDTWTSLSVSRDCACSYLTVRDAEGSCSVCAQWLDWDKDKWAWHSSCGSTGTPLLAASVTGCCWSVQRCDLNTGTRSCLTLLLHVLKIAYKFFSAHANSFYQFEVCFICGWICLRHRVLNLCARAVGMWPTARTWRSARSSGPQWREWRKGVSGERGPNSGVQNIWAEEDRRCWSPHGYT